MSVTTWGALLVIGCREVGRRMPVWWLIFLILLCMVVMHRTATSTSFGESILSCNRLNSWLLCCRRLVRMSNREIVSSVGNSNVIFGWVKAIRPGEFGGIASLGE